MSFYKVKLAKDKGELAGSWERSLKNGASKDMDSYVKSITKGTNSVGVSKCTGAMGKKHNSKY